MIIAKKIISSAAAILCAALLFCSCAGENETAPTAAPPDNAAPDAEINIGFLQGPTGMGAAYLMEENELERCSARYNIQTAAEPSAFTAALISGELDMAALPVNSAAVLYAKTQGRVRMLAVNTLGVMYILDRSGCVASVADLKGKTVLSAGQGASPEYVLDFILEKNGLVPGKDVTVEYASEHAETAARALAGKYDVVLLPEPFVTKLCMTDGGFAVALDLTEEWSRLGSGVLLTGCIAVRAEFADENPEAVKAFLADYEKSVAWTLENTEEAAALMEKHGIIAADIAKAALPACNITFMTGEEMKTNAQGYLGVLFAADAASVGGSMPGDDFYCTGFASFSAE